MIYTKDADGNIIFNVSSNLPNFSQRNNEYIDKVTKKCTALVACNVTSMAMGLSYAGYNIPIKYTELSQPEDNLIKFADEDPAVSSYYKEKMPGMYADWVARKAGCYPPNELHDMLSYSVNLYMGCKATYFSTNVPVKSIMTDLSLTNVPVVMSGNFCGFGHIVCLVGFKTKPEFLTKLNTTKEITDDFRDLVLNWIIDDPYGDFRNGYKPVLPGNNISMTNDQFYSMLKPLNDRYIKWAHRFNRPAAVV